MSCQMRWNQQFTYQHQLAGPQLASQFQEILMFRLDCGIVFIPRDLRYTLLKRVLTHTFMRSARVFTTTVFLISCLVPLCYANEDILNGLWMETANFPASSILKFERDGDRIVGRYRQVSTPQKLWGFTVGETVIRGAFNGNVFRGEVLLKLTKDFIDRCPDVAVG